MNTAFVKIWGELVGAVAWDEKTSVATFEYDPKFKQLGYDLAPLKMPITSEKSIFYFPELKKKESQLDTFKGLPGLLADALPDRYGNDLINIWLAQQGRASDSMNPVEMLCFIGKRAMGALEFEPATLKEKKLASTIEIVSLIEIAKKILAKKTDFSTNISENEEKALMQILKIGTSAGGARPKAVIAYNEQTGEVRSGQTNAPKGFTHWLLKLDGVSDIQLGESQGYGRVEIAYYNMAVACGIEMMPSLLLEESGRAHFMTKRFDRYGSDIKHHIQTFCGIKHFDFNEANSFSYEQLFQTMRELRMSYPEAEQMFRRMVFNVLARNCDDHTKNFAFILKKGDVWKLAPAYDVCHAYRPNSEWVSQHALSINGKRKNITKEDLLNVGKSINSKKSKEIIDEIENTISNWKTFANEVNISSHLREAIAKTLINFK